MLRAPRNRKHLSIGLTVIGLLLITHGTLFAEFKIGFYGLIDSFPITLFIGLGLLAIASTILWTSSEHHPKILGVQLLILVSVLWLAPNIVGGSHPFTDHAYRSLGLIEYMSRTGDMSSDYFIYLSWPGALIPMGWISKLFQVNFEPLIGYAPFIMQVLYGFPLYIILRKTLGKQHRNYCWVGLWIFYLASWTGETYLGSAPGLGLLLLLILMALATTCSIQWKNKKSLILLVCIIVTYGFLVTVHLLLSGLALLITPILLLLKNNKRRIIPVFGVCLVLIIFWGITGGARYTTLVVMGIDPLPSYISTGLVLYTEDFEIKEPPIEGFWGELKIPERLSTAGVAFTLNPKEIIETQIGSHLIGNESHNAVVKTRLVYSGLMALLGLLGSTIAFLNKRDRKLVLLMLGIALVPMVCLVLPYGGRMTERVYPVMLIPLAYFSARLWAEHRGRLITIGLCVFLITCMPLHFIVHYGNQRVDYYSLEQLNGVRYFQENMPKGSIVGLDWLWTWQNSELYYQNSFLALGWNKNKITEIYRVNPRYAYLISMITPPDPLYFPITKHDKDLYSHLYNTPQFVDQVEELLVNSESCSLIYDTPDFRLYLIEIEDRIEGR